MIVLYYISTVLLSWSLKLSSDNSDNRSMFNSVDVFDRKSLFIYVCVAKCLENGGIDNDKTQSPNITHNFNKKPFEDGNEKQNGGLKECVLTCDRESNFQTNSSRVKQIQENYILDLVCREEKRIHFRINEYKLRYTTNSITIPDKVLQIKTENSSQLSPKNKIFVIKINMKDNTREYKIYLSDSEFFSINDLVANGQYNITVFAVYSNSLYSVIAKQEQFRTLRHGYRTSSVSDIKIHNFSGDSSRKNHLKATISWKSSNVRTCFYEIICYAPESDNYELTPIEISNPETLYSYQLRNLSFGTLYKVGIRSRNPSNRKESALFWHTFQTPDCKNWPQKDAECVLLVKPRDLSVELAHLKNNMYSMNLTWSLPEHLPDYYVLEVFDLSQKQEFKINRGNYHLSKESTNVFITEILLLGEIYEVVLEAYTSDGQIATQSYQNAISYKKVLQPTSFIIAIIAGAFSILCIILVLMALTFKETKQWRRKHSLTFCKNFTKCCSSSENKSAQSSQKEQHYSLEILSKDEVVGKLVGINLKDEQCVQDQSFDQDDLEIDRNNLVLQEILGEGAFGRVKRGLYQIKSNNPKTVEVAVKMLKEKSSEDEIDTLFQEIEMIKSVQQHPNIVKLIGYSTRCRNNLILLTEYCSHGNLLNFLRSKWHFYQVNKIQLPNCPWLLPDAFPDVIKNSGFYLKYAHCSKNANKVYQLNTEDFSEKCIENKDYKLGGQLIEKKLSVSLPTSCVQYKSKNKTEVVLTLLDLLHFVGQVASGMEFLSKHKVVHRDLAARNILVSEDLSIKISDFGLSRVVYHESVYRKIGNVKLPIKWLALESLTHQIFTTYSDVWSFGILFYEIVTFGSTPYPSIPINCLVNYLQMGYRMEKPSNCPEDFYNLMCSCWHETPSKRPTFEEICRIIVGMISRGEKGNFTKAI